MIGSIVAVGPGEKKWCVGDRVGGAWHGGHDGTCKACNRGLFQMCDNAVANGINHDGGCKYGVFILHSLNGRDEKHQSS
jgi:D-arabinose 1-dehydrogenase-like Zn-dependent alcohol dehydrogenase